MRIPVMTMNASITSSENSVSDLMVASLVLYKSFVARSGIMFSWHWVSCNLSISLVQLSRKRLKEYLYIFPCYNSFQNLITKNNVRASTFVVIGGSTVIAAILVNIIVVSFIVNATVVFTLLVVSTFLIKPCRFFDDLLKLCDSDWVEKLVKNSLISSL